MGLSASVNDATIRRLQNELAAAERSLDLAVSAGDKAWVARADVRIAACKIELQRFRVGADK
jgi:hypothetical protein